MEFIKSFSNDEYIGIAILEHRLQLEVNRSLSTNYDPIGIFMDLTCVKQNPRVIFHKVSHHCIFSSSCQLFLSDCNFLRQLFVTFTTSYTIGLFLDQISMKPLNWLKTIHSVLLQTLLSLSKKKQGILSMMCIIQRKFEVVF